MTGMIYRCENCGHREEEADLHLHRESDELWCMNCLDNEAEAAYERLMRVTLESPPESSREEQLRTWEEHQKAHKR